jgi:hypothetical protein
MGLVSKHTHRTTPVGAIALELLVFIAVAALLAGVATSVYLRVIHYSEQSEISQSALALDHSALYTAALYSLPDASVDPHTGKLFVLEAVGQLQGGKLVVSQDSNYPDRFSVRSVSSNLTVCLITSGLTLVGGSVVDGACSK